PCLDLAVDLEAVSIYRLFIKCTQSCSHIGNLCNADVLTAMLQNAKDPRVTAVLPATVAALNVLAVVFPHW
ncbi:hypothetical protein J6590_092859, partial [Homalodisca vitripennis]